MDGLIDQRTFVGVYVCLFTCMSVHVSLPIGLIKSVNPQSERKLGKRSCILLFQIPVCNDIKAKNAETAEIFSNPFSISAFKYSAGL